MAVVNTHHLGDQIARHVAARARPRIVISHEDVLLDTGGGVKKALSLLGRRAVLRRQQRSALDRRRAAGA